MVISLKMLWELELASDWESDANSTGVMRQKRVERGVLSKQRWRPGPHYGFSAQETTLAMSVLSM